MTQLQPAEPKGGAASAWRKGIALAYGAACHVAFTIGVGAMIIAMYHGMTRTFGTLASPWRWIANAALVLQFFVSHSFLLTRRGQSVLSALVPAPFGGRLATTTYALIASLQLLVLFTLWSPSGIIWWQAKGATLWFMTAFYGGAWLLLLKSIWDAGIELQTGMLGWRALHRGVMPVFPDMPTRGLFRLIRQPIYLAFALTLWTVPVWTPDQLLVSVVLTGYCLAGPLLKERRFLRRFGARFAAYQAATPYWVPRMWNRNRHGQ